jgi:hypothetical protein
MRPMLVSAGSENDGTGENLASALASSVGGAIVPTAAGCAADVAHERHASLVVVSTAGRHGAILTHPAEQWLRTCTLPMLFVPAVVTA